jgi:hypothetical protein
MRAENLWKYQRDLMARPSVWLVLDNDGAVSGIYDCRAAAECEMVYRRGRGDRGYSIQREQICDVDLSRRRWR